TTKSRTSATVSRFDLAPHAHSGGIMTTQVNCWSVALVLLGGAACCDAADKPADPVPLARAFVDLLAKGDFEGASKRCDEAMLKALPPAKLGESWKKLTEQVGPFQKQLGTRTDKADKYDRVYVTCQFEKAKLDVRVVFDSERRVTGLQTLPAME